MTQSLPTIAVSLPNSLALDMRGAVALLRLARPEKRNALDDATVAGLEAFFTNLPDETRAVVLHAEGAHFCAGLDLSAITETDVLGGIAHSRSWHRAFERIESGPVPVVAVLHGAVVGGGLELAAACHIRVAERSAYYALPEGRHGIFVGGGGSVRLPRLIGLARMTDMMLTGRTYGADEGATCGFSQYIVAEGEGLSSGIEIAERIATNAVLTNLAVLQALPRIAESERDAGFMMESLTAAIASSDQEAKARLRSFLEGRASKVVRDPE